MSIPTAVKAANGELKRVLKQAVRGVIPDELIDRPKQGFGVPVAEWLTDRLGDQAQEDIDGLCRGTDLLDAEATRGVLTRRAGPEAWYLQNLALWWRENLA